MTVFKKKPPQLAHPWNGAVLEPTKVVVFFGGGPVPTRASDTHSQFPESGGKSCAKSVGSRWGDTKNADRRASFLLLLLQKNGLLSTSVGTPRSTPMGCGRSLAEQILTVGANLMARISPADFGTNLWLAWGWSRTNVRHRTRHEIPGWIHVKISNQRRKIHLMNSPKIRKCI